MHYLVGFIYSDQRQKTAREIVVLKEVWQILKRSADSLQASIDLTSVVRCTN